MDNRHALRQYLDTLTTYLDIPGADLYAMLDVLIDDITAAVPTFLGLRLTTTAGGASTTITAVDRHPAPAARSSLLLPLHDITGAAPGDTMILYAAQPGAFGALATATRDTFNLDGQVRLDQHLPTAGPLTALGQNSTEDPRLVNIAIGILIDQGHPPEQARAELTGRAGGHDNLTAAARELLDSL